MSELPTRAENSVGNSGKPRRGNPEKIKPYRFRPGQSGNPGGRPKNLLTEAYRDVLERRVPGDPEGRTFAQAIAFAVAREAVRGNIRAAVEIADRTEGKAMQGVQMSGAGDGPIGFEPLSPEENEQRIAQLLRQLGYSTIPQ